MQLYDIKAVLLVIVVISFQANVPIKSPKNLVGLLKI